ncbi:MAG: hypothetical protein K8S16_03365 [Bacteroidales bacterium]|nr:hypothetical protein [Bacteroidales bacterium]
MKKKYNIPWLTEEGYFDYSKYPIEHPAKDSLSNDKQKFRNACRLLGSMANEGRKDAAIFLFGLIYYYNDDIKRLEIIVENFKYFETKECVNFLFSEIKRVKSSNTTRKYINTIIDTLLYFPSDLVLEKFIEFSKNQKFTYRMRNKFLAVVEELKYETN